MRQSTSLGEARDLHWNAIGNCGFSANFLGGTSVTTISFPERPASGSATNKSTILFQWVGPIWLAEGDS